MESIKFYKLISPYPEDVTMNCKLSMSDIDENFLTFKNNDVSSATFDCENMIIDIIKNNGDRINLDISCIREEFDEKLDDVISIVTSGTVEIDISGEFSEDGILTLYWNDAYGDHSTEISGYVGLSSVKRDSSLKGDGSDSNPMGISNTDQTGQYKPIIDVVDKLPIPGTYNLLGDFVQADSNEATINYSDDDITGQGAQGSGGEISVLRNGIIRFFANRGYVQDGSNHIKIYGTNTVDGESYMEFTARDDSTIVGIFITATGDGYIRNWVDQNGNDAIIADNTATWHGSEQYVKLTNQNAGQARITSIVITYTTPIEPGREINVGERWVTKHTVSTFGRLYSKPGLVVVKNELLKCGDTWRVPTKDDWDKLLTYAEDCDLVISGDTIGEYQGDICGKMLKSANYWVGNENVDEYGFSALPSGYVLNSLLNGADEQCRFWTDTEYEDGHNYIIGFSYDEDGVLQDEEEHGGWYSIRLVRDIDKDLISDSVNILGNTYNVVNFPEIGLSWIKFNLNFDAGSSNSELFDYGHDGTIFERYLINHWNGKTWDRKELNNGDQFNTTSGNTITEYTCIEDEYGNQNLVSGLKYKFEDNTTKLIIDAGWY